MKRRGISPVIAVLLLIVIAVAAAILTYVWITGYIGTLQTQSTGQQLQERIKIEAVDIGAGGGSLTIYVRNVGETAVTISAAYLINATNGDVLASNTDLSVGINPGDVSNGVTITDISAGVWVDGKTYVVKVVTAKGTEATYQFLYRS